MSRKFSVETQLKPRIIYADRAVTSDGELRFYTELPSDSDDSFDDEQLIAAFSRGMWFSFIEEKDLDPI